MNVPIWLCLLMGVWLMMAGGAVFFAFPRLNNLQNNLTDANTTIAKLTIQLSQRSTQLTNLQLQHDTLNHQFAQAKRELSAPRPNVDDATTTAMMNKVTAERDVALRAKSEAEKQRDVARHDLIGLQAKTVKLAETLRVQTDELKALQQTFATHHGTVEPDNAGELQTMLDESVVTIHDLEQKLQAQIALVKEHEKQIAEQEDWIDLQQKKLDNLLATQ